MSFVTICCLFISQMSFMFSLLHVSGTYLCVYLALLLDGPKMRNAADDDGEKAKENRRKKKRKEERTTTQNERTNRPRSRQESKLTVVYKCEHLLAVCCTEIIRLSNVFCIRRALDFPTFLSNTANEKQICRYARKCQMT